MIIRSRSIFLIGIILFQFACREKEKLDLAITNIHLIDVVTGEVQSNRVVIIHNKRIFSIDSGKLSDAYTYKKLHYAEGKYMIPGMWDMHAHPDDPEVWRMNPTKEARDMLMPLFVTNGVTGIRDMGGDLGVVKRWRQMGEEGRLLVPEIVACGPLLDGPNPMWDGSVGINGPEEVPKVVDSLIEAGIDFLKVYSLLPRNTYFALADYANRKKVPFVGHVPMTVLPSETATTGMKSQEHLLEIINETFSDKNGLDQLDTIEDRYGRYAARNQYMIDHFDRGKMDSLNKLFVKNDIYQTPTLSMWKKNAWFEEEVIKDDSLLSYLPHYLRKYWTVGVNDHLNNRDNQAFIDTKRSLYQQYLVIVRMMNKAGVQLLAGTDMGANPLCFPGIGLHNELADLVYAGLSPLEALQTATINPSRFLEMDDYYGTLEKDKYADLVILDKNPLENIENIRSVDAVIKSGELYPSEALKEIKKMIQESHKSTQNGKH